MKISVQVKPNSTKGPLVQKVGNGLVVYVREPSVDGKANAALMVLVAKYYKVSKSRVKIVRGQTSKLKVLEIDL